MLPPPSLPVAASGLGLGLSLIVAIGAQNAFVLRQGLRLEHVGAVVGVCIASDAALIAAGTAGAGAALHVAPWLLPGLRVLGGVFLLAYAALAARRALRPSVLAPQDDRTSTSLASSLLTCLALTWLNPHVYLDTVVLVGSLAASHGAQRWTFAAGAATGSLVWFTALGFGARLLRPVFARPAAWQVLDATIAVVMTALAVALLAGV